MNGGPAAPTPIQLAIEDISIVSVLMAANDRLLGAFTLHFKWYTSNGASKGFWDCMIDSSFIQ